MSESDQAKLPAGVLTIFCEWKLVSLVVGPVVPGTRRKTFVHRRGDILSVTRMVGAKLAGHVLMSVDDFRAVATLVG